MKTRKKRGARLLIADRVVTLIESPGEYAEPLAPFRTVATSKTAGPGRGRTVDRIAGRFLALDCAADRVAQIRVRVRATPVGETAGNYIPEKAITL